MDYADFQALCHNIKTDGRETGSGGMDWTGLTQDSGQLKALVNTVINSRIP
jgi:hypothetical protein